MLFELTPAVVGIIELVEDSLELVWVANDVGVVATEEVRKAEVAAQRLGGGCSGGGGGCGAGRGATARAT